MNYGKGLNKLSLLIAVLAAGSLLAAMAGSAGAETFRVELKNSPYRFDPSTLNIKQGDTVTWTNAPPGIGHNVQTGRRSDPSGWGFPARGPWHADYATQWTSPPRVHDQVGTFKYYCAVLGHAWDDVDDVPTSGQVMTVNVAPADSTSPTGPTGPSGGGPTGPTGPSGGGPGAGSGPTAQSPGATQPAKKSKKGKKKTKKSKKSKSKGKGKKKGKKKK